MGHKDPAKRRAYVQAYRARLGKNSQRKYWLKKKYNLTLEQYDQMLADQKDRCKLCLRHRLDFKRGYELAVDHCHKTGIVRGLLCYACNKLLGRLEDVGYMNRVKAHLELTKHYH